MTSKIGFFLFVGLVGGAILGHLVYNSPAVGAIGLGALGFLLGLYLDYSAGRSSESDEDL